MAKVIVDSWVMAEARDIKRSIEFYSKLGFKPTRRMPYYVEFKVPGGTVLGLHSAGKGKGKGHGEKNTGGWGIMLRVGNIRKLVANLKRKRIRCTPAKMAPGGAYFSSF
jgi:catechol 2,3-dioxygenase-like lactoylglutathione lyase family enzyme